VDAREPGEPIADRDAEKPRTILLENWAMGDHCGDAERRRLIGGTEAQRGTRGRTRKRDGRHGAHSARTREGARKKSEFRETETQNARERCIEG